MSMHHTSYHIQYLLMIYIHSFFFDLFSTTYTIANSLHFTEVNYVAAFQEYEFELTVNNDEVAATTISGWSSCGCVVPYSNGEDDDG